MLLLDAWALLSRADLRAGEEALRRWMAAAALARPGGRVVVVAEHRLPAYRRWSAGTRPVPPPASWPTATALGFPPATRMAAVTGSARRVADLLAHARRRGEVLGPVPAGEGERAFLRVPRAEGPRWPRH